MLFYETARTLLGPLFSLRFRIKVEGKENVPEEGGALIIANHRSYLDPLVIAYSVDRFVNFGAGSHLYLFPGSRPIFELVGFFEVNIYGGKEGDRSIDTAGKLLREGELVGLFPEGIESFMYVHRGSKISEFKTGFARIALENHVPIIPCAIIAEEEKEFFKIPGFLATPFVKHPKAKSGVELITYRKVTCRIGKPLDLSPLYDEPITKNLMDMVAAKVRRIVTKLYDGEDLERFLTGEKPFNFSSDKV